MKGKICTGCNLNKPETEFYAHALHKDGKHGKCKECIKAYNKSKYRERRLKDMGRSEIVLSNLVVRLEAIEAKLHAMENSRYETI